MNHFSFLSFLSRSIKNFLSKDYFNLVLLFFIFISFAFKVYKKNYFFKIKYFIDTDFVKIDENGRIFFRYNGYENAVKLTNLKLPSNKDRCFHEFMIKFQQNLIDNVFIKNNKMDIYIEKKNIFRENEGEVFVDNVNLLNIIKNFIPNYQILINSNTTINWCEML